MLNIYNCRKINEENSLYLPQDLLLHSNGYSAAILQSFSPSGIYERGADSIAPTCLT